MSNIVNSRIIYTNFDGALHVIIPSETWEGTIEELAKKDVPEGLEYKIVEKSLVPEDRSFRAAWQMGKRGVDVCMDKARAIHIEKLRKIRHKKFVDMGFPYRLSEEIESAMVSEKTREKLCALRDFPQQLDLSGVKTPAELSQTIPDILKD